MKCALHIHTNFSDGFHSPEQMINAYQERGFKCLAITDHQFLLPPNYFRYLERLSLNLKKQGIILLVGVEREYSPWQGQHLLEIRGEKETLYVLCHPRAYLLSPKEVMERARSSPIRIDAIEITYRGIYTPEYDIAQIPLPKIATDDAHEAYEVGQAWIETDDFQNPDQLIQAVRKGEFKVRFASR